MKSMKRKTILTLIGLLAVLPLAATGVSEQYAEQYAAAELGPIVRGDDLARYRLTDAEGDLVGRVDDMIIDLRNGYVPYLISNFGEIPGVEPDLKPLPLRLVQPGESERALQLSFVRMDAIRNVPSVSQLERGAIDELGWVSQMQSFWANYGVPVNQRPVNRNPEGDIFYSYSSGVGVVPGTLTRYSDFAGTSIANDEGDSIATVRTMLLDLQTGDTRYLLVDPTGPRSEVAVPLAALTYNVSAQRVALPAGLDILLETPEHEVPTGIIQPGWDEELRDYWQQATGRNVVRPGVRMVPRTTMRATTLAGYDLVDRNIRGLGTVEDLVINDDGDVPYAVVDFRNVLGLEGNNHFLPLGTLSVDVFNAMIVFNLNPTRLTGMDGLGRERVPEVLPADWDQNVRSYWEQRLAPLYGQVEAAPATPRAVLATALVDYPVVNAQGTALGDVVDLMINLEDGEVSFLVMSRGGVLGIGDELYAVPMDALTIRTQQRDVVVPVSAQTLESAPAFGQNDWPDTTESGWDQQILQYWNR